MICIASRIASFCFLVLLLVGCGDVVGSAATDTSNQSVTTVSISPEVPSAVVQTTSDTQESSKTAESYYKAGFASYRRGDYKPAIASFSEAIKSEPDYAPAFLGRAQAHRQQRDDQEALNDVNQFIALEPNDPDGFYNRGDIYLTMGSYDQAIADFDQTIKMKSDYVGAYVDRGLAFEYKGKYADAIVDL